MGLRAPGSRGSRWWMMVAVKGGGALGARRGGPEKKGRLGYTREEGST